MKQLLMNLLHAKTETEVKSIIESDSLLKDPNNWIPYGGSAGNYSSFENQQSTAMGALVEKFTNSLDAVLTRRCWELGIDPSSEAAPQSMNEAVNMLFDEIALENAKIKVFTDGTKDEVNVISFDYGEGQLPEKFKDTLLSLQKGNKNSIKFVQGKYNMGSTGAAVFCGKYKYQLYMSKRHNSLDKGNNKVGFTIVRKHERKEEELKNTKNTWYEYFVLNNDVPFISLAEDEFIEIIPNVKESRFTHGTVIKMYNYALPSKTQSFQKLKEEINKLLYQPALPIEVYETRKEYDIVKKRGAVMNVAYGNSVILRKKLDNVNPVYESLGNVIQDDLFGEAHIDLYVFDKKEDIKEIRGKKPIVFLMNGQVQYALGTSYISSTLGYKLLKETLLVVIDCTHLSPSFLDEGLFMANRETIRDTENTRFLLEKIKYFLANHKELEFWNREKANQQVTSESTTKMLESILGKGTKNSLLKNLFKDNPLGMASSNRNHRNGKDKDKDKDKETLYEYPTYMKINYKQNSLVENSKTVAAFPLDTFKLNLKINATDDYFVRDENPGKLSIKVKSLVKDNKKSGGNKPGNNKTYETLCTITKTSLKDGNMSIFFDPKKEDIQVGDEVEIKINLEDTNDTFTHVLPVKFVDADKKEPKKNNKGTKEKLSLPPLIQVYKNEEVINKLVESDEDKSNHKTWYDMEWNEEDGASHVVRIEPSPNADEPIGCIFINMNCKALEQIIIEDGSTGTKQALIRNQFLTQIYMQTFMNALALTKMKNTSNTDSEIMNEDTVVEMEEFVEKMINETAYIQVKMQINNIINAKELEFV